MWMFPRNIRRIEPWKLTQISSALEVCIGDVQSQDVQDELYKQLSELGVKSGFFSLFPLAFRKFP